MHLRLTFAVLVFLAMYTTGVAQQAGPYEAPRTAFGHPDFQGVWVTEFLTMLERPPGVDELVVSRAQSEVLAAAFRSQQPDVIDPPGAVRRYWTACGSEGRVPDVRDCRT